MIIEFFKYLSNPASRSAKKMGQLQETIAMEARYKRSKNQWASHLENSKNIIRSATLSVSETSDIIILGSGLLLDIPIKYLAEKFNRVYLVDVVHLRKTKRLTRQYNNVIFIEHDITDLSEQMLNKPATGINFTPALEIPALSEKTGLVVSANMLSQIHLAPVFYAKKHLNINDLTLEKLAHDIMLSHVSLLTNTHCKVCLIADHKRLYKDHNQNIIETEEVLFGINMPEPDDSWYWEIAPEGELQKNLSMKSQVYGYKDFHF